MSNTIAPTNRQVTFKLDGQPSATTVKLCAKIQLSVLKPLMEQINKHQILKTYKHIETENMLQPSSSPSHAPSKKRKQPDQTEKEKKKTKPNEDSGVCFVPLASCVLQEKNIPNVVSVIQKTPAMRLTPLGIMHLTMEPIDNPEHCTLFLNLVNADDTLKTMLTTIQDQDPWEKTQTKLECVPCVPLCDVMEVMGSLFSRTLKVSADVAFPVAELYIRDEANAKTLAYAKCKPLSLKKKKSQASKSTRAPKNSDITVEATLTVTCYSTQGIETAECISITETGPKNDKSKLSERLKSRLDMLNTTDAWQQILSQLTEVK